MSISTEGHMQNLWWGLYYELSAYTPTAHIYYLVFFLSDQEFFLSHCLYTGPFYCISFIHKIQTGAPWWLFQTYSSFILLLSCLLYFIWPFFIFLSLLIFIFLRIARETPDAGSEHLVCQNNWLINMILILMKIK